MYVARAVGIFYEDNSVLCICIVFVSTVYVHHARFHIISELTGISVLYTVRYLQQICNVQFMCLCVCVCMRVFSFLCPTRVYWSVVVP